jgi:putative ABC transport system substrate-binding protein
LLLIMVIAASVMPLLPTTGGAQHSGKTWRIGLCHVGLDHEPPSLPTLKQALSEKGYVEGKNLVFDWRNQESETTANAQTRAWVAAGYDLLVAFEDQCVRAARAASTTIPIVMVHAFDPASAGYIKSLARPGGNITGPASSLNLIGKRLELLKEIDSRLRRVLVLTDHRDPFAPRQMEIARQAAATLRLELVERNTPTLAELERVFAALGPREADAVLVASPDVITNLTRPILALAQRARLAIAAHRKGWVELGALFSYAPDYPAAGTVAARYVDQIFKGAKAAEIPVEEISAIDLVVNRGVAKKLGITIPPAVLLRAAEVID